MVPNLIDDIKRKPNLFSIKNKVVSGHASDVLTLVFVDLERLESYSYVLSLLLCWG